MDVGSEQKVEVNSNARVECFESYHWGIMERCYAGAGWKYCFDRASSGLLLARAKFTAT